MQEYLLMFVITFWKRFIRGLSNSIEGSRIANHWSESQCYDNTITSAGRELWTTCIAVSYHKDVTIISVNDDQLQLRYLLNAVEGATGIYQ